MNDIDCRWNDCICNYLLFQHTQLLVLYNRRRWISAKKNWRIFLDWIGKIRNFSRHSNLTRMRSSSRLTSLFLPPKQTFWLQDKPPPPPFLLSF